MRNNAKELASPGNVTWVHLFGSDIRGFPSLEHSLYTELMSPHTPLSTQGRVPENIKEVNPETSLSCMTRHKLHV